MHYGSPLLHITIMIPTTPINKLDHTLTTPVRVTLATPRRKYSFSQTTMKLVTLLFLNAHILSVLG